MNKEFVPYEQALELKELGFDEECLGYYFTTNGENWEFATDSEFDMINETLDIGQNFIIPALLYQQAFRWFRENHTMFYDCLKYVDNKWKFTTYSNNVDDHYQSSGYIKYEEAELACLNKLIEIVKAK